MQTELSKHQKYSRSPKGRARDARYRLSKPHRIKARAIARKVAKGIDVTPCPCCGSVVGNVKHHPDYRRPKVFEWLCIAEHARRHRTAPNTAT